MGINNIIPKNLWKDKDAQKLNLSQKLVYRSQLLGADLQVTNFGGGNTSSKLLLKDPLSNKLTKVMLVKGSGGDLGTIKLFSNSWNRKKNNEKITKTFINLIFLIPILQKITNSFLTSYLFIM